ncbi:MAG: GDP-mannose 4,6-dehydratase [Deferribacterota bacterium]|nr:GDP-mannose 4,6-dehydratase [Deferribacterota bacterium]
MKILVTGSAGFIGFWLSKALLEKGFLVYGLDNLNEYYDVKLKFNRLNNLKNYANFFFQKIDLSDLASLDNLFRENNFNTIINIAARAGVRYSLLNPYIYYETNVLGTLNLLNLSKKYNTEQFIQASTSSVYSYVKPPFSENDKTDKPISPYAATKKSAELLCFTYHHLHKLNITILRFFTVYGPSGRPDMSIFNFIEHIKNNREITIFGDGTQKRDFTYIEDIIDGILNSLNLTGFNIINLGNNKPKELNYIITLIENSLNKKAKIKYKPFNNADMFETWADIELAKKILNWNPKTSIEKGIEKTATWHMENDDFLRKLTLP